MVGGGGMGCNLGQTPFLLHLPGNKKKDIFTAIKAHMVSFELPGVSSDTRTASSSSAHW
jgi:hypothetical protein